MRSSSPIAIQGPRNPERKEPGHSFEIDDEGPGIREEDKPRLFQRFQKLHAQPTDGESSTGLGLSIVKKYVEAMDGKVWCESEFGKGARFIVEFQK
jgi:two-component system sensor histidine kinase/response regulator